MPDDGLEPLRSPWYNHVEMAALFCVKGEAVLPTQSNPTTIGEFQAHFGSPPGSQDARADCAKWERLCAELIEERSRLQLELAKATAQNEAYLKSLCAIAFQGFKFDLTMDEVYAQVDRTTSLDQLIAELEQESQAT
jgi:hypothetical protein